MNPKSAASLLAFATVIMTARATDAPGSSVSVDAADANNASKASVAEIHVSTSETDEERGILILVPRTLSASGRGTEVELEYRVANTLEESLFVETEPMEWPAMSYSDDSGNRSGNGRSSRMHNDYRYALLAGCDYSGRERRIHRSSVVSRKARVKLPDAAKAGAILTVTLQLRGYFKSNGKPFSGTVKAQVTLSE